MTRFYIALLSTLLFSTTAVAQDTPEFASGADLARVCSENEIALQTLLPTLEGEGWRALDSAPEYLAEGQSADLSPGGLALIHELSISILSSGSPGREAQTIDRARDWLSAFGDGSRRMAYLGDAGQRLFYHDDIGLFAISARPSGEFVDVSCSFAGPSAAEDDAFRRTADGRDSQLAFSDMKRVEGSGVEAGIYSGVILRVRSKVFDDLFNTSISDLTVFDIRALR